MEALAPQKINVKVIANPQRRLAKLLDCAAFADDVLFSQVPRLDGCLDSNSAVEFSEPVDTACGSAAAFWFVQMHVCACATIW